MATSIATRALPPKVAVGLAAVLNFAGAFISLDVAATIAADGLVGEVLVPAVIAPALALAVAAATAPEPGAARWAEPRSRCAPGWSSWGCT